METLSNQYIFITTEGETIAPNSEYSIENCQIIGIVDSESEKGAIHKLIEENPWIESSGFDVTQARCIQLLTENIKNDIRCVVDYLWRDELSHYEECESEEKKNHIFNVLMRLSNV